MNEIFRTKAVDFYPVIHKSHTCIKKMFRMYRVRNTKALSTVEKRFASEGCIKMRKVTLEPFPNPCLFYFPEVIVSIQGRKTIADSMVHRRAREEWIGSLVFHKIGDKGWMKNEGLAPGQRRIVVKEKKGIRITGGEGKVWAVYGNQRAGWVGLSSLDR